MNSGGQPTWTQNSPTTIFQQCRRHLGKGNNSQLPLVSRPLIYIGRERASCLLASLERKEWSNSQLMYIPFFHTTNPRSSKHTKSVILLILLATRLSKRVYHTSTTMARLVLFSTLRGVQLVFRVKRLLETDTLRKDCMSVLNMFDTPDVVMVYIFC
jgi:hypothetical protein